MTCFLDLPADLTAYESSRYVIVPFPLERSTSYMRGTARAPQAIIDASAQVEAFDSELLYEPCEAGIHTHKAIPTPDKTSVEDILKRSADTCARIIADKKIPVFLGGEHTITIGPVQGTLAALKQSHKDTPLGILHIDAHADLRDQYLDDPYSHACVMRRILSPDVKIASVGIRSLCEEEYAVAKGASNILLIRDDVRTTAPATSFVEKVLRFLPEHVYITLDLDGLSPALMPAVGTPEPGGFEWYDLLALLKQVMLHKQVLAFDINELMPKKYFEHAEFIAAKLAYKMIAYHHKFSRA